MLGFKKPVGFVFKTEGTSLAGSTIGIDGIDLPLKNGKIKEQVVSFTVDIDIGGLPAQLAYRGVVSVDKIDFLATFMGEPVPIKNLVFVETIAVAADDA
jgi:hypothetical protein